MKPNRLYFAAATVLSVTVCLAISVVYARGINYAPDEGNHLSMVFHHCDTLTLATWEDMRWGTERGHAYHLFSPLPYLSHILWWRQARLLMDPADWWAARTLVRFGGIPIAMLQFWLTFLIARLVFRSKWKGLLGALSINLLPQLRYLHGYVNADAASILMATVCAWLLLRLIMGEETTGRTALFIGLALAGLAHAKYNVWIVSAPLFIVFVVRTWHTTGEWRTRLRLIGTAVLIPAILAGWFHLHVYEELANGHVLAGRDHQELMRSTFTGVPTRPGKNLSTRFQELDAVWRTATGTFARKGSLPRWYRNTLLAGSLLGTAAVFLVFSRRRTKISRVLALYCATGLAILISTYVFLSMQPELHIQGRLLLGFLPFSPVLLWGIEHLLRDLALFRVFQSALFVGFIAFMLAGNILMTRLL
jgi:4-amino-4-deoxy-L-arabinose transferase-like glycosyltransferase